MSTMTPRPSPVPIPPLKDGEVLTRDEFERRYDAMPDLKKAELIEGVVYVASSVSLIEHGSPHTDLSCWLGSYRASTTGVIAGDNSSVRLDLGNEPQPDLLMMIHPDRGGQARLVKGGFADGAPELVAEIAASSAGLERGKKRLVYERHGVREYLIWRVRDAAFDWFILRDGRFEDLAPNADGTLRNEVFPGVWMDPEALLRGDLAGVLAVLQRGIASPEHAAFLERLGRA
ncbi:hypothetical protein OJF2_32170 [Aquisphaera giovannonii]|uniref:Putative restriction endonuclease domain-containing protein n=1 Tax=Aquisphaera giovannonii TaxID=406548 RepID=A0A5B9W242_9BACT|nr:Uma2 family endonuclease [Aquisphaera giovannonii]QEH34676.1 hypothetical protein OJF2_32170 [Aquisphaera giovannonii]